MAIDWTPKTDSVDKITAEIFNKVFDSVQKEFDNIINGNTRVERANMAESATRSDKADADSLGNLFQDHYATKAEIGDRSTLYDSPNDDLVTAINHAWNNGESARGIAENAQNSADSANIELGTLKNGLTSGVFLVGNSQHADRADMDSQGNVINEHYATKAEIGNIETALDNIIAIQNSLIGGGSV